MRIRDCVCVMYDGCIMRICCFCLTLLTVFEQSVIWLRRYAQSKQQYRRRQDRDIHTNMLHCEKSNISYVWAD